MTQPQGSSFIQELRRGNALVRKSFDYAGRLPRLLQRLNAAPEDYARCPPILVNSIPKSGTHLLKQIAEALPAARSYGSFIASVPSFPPIPRSESAHLRRIHAIAPGEVVGAHMFHAASFEQALQKRNVVHLLIYRDPRDIALSEGLYLAHMNRWHYMHREFRALPDDDQRLMASICGLPDQWWRPRYDSISGRVAPFLGWLQSESVCALKYEDLMGPARQQCVEKIVRFYAGRSTASCDVADVMERVESNIDPQRSHTFREGGSGNWKKAYNESHRQAFERVADGVLEKLGYA